jgi:hypothetical protein
MVNHSPATQALRLTQDVGIKTSQFSISFANQSAPRIEIKSHRLRDATPSAAQHGAASVLQVAAQTEALANRRRCAMGAVGCTGARVPGRGRLKASRDRSEQRGSMVAIRPKRLRPDDRRAQRYALCGPSWHEHRRRTLPDGRLLAIVAALWRAVRVCHCRTAKAPADPLQASLRMRTRRA